MCSIIQVKRWRHKELKGATCSQSEQKSRVHTWDSDPKVWAYESLLPWEKNVGHAKELKKKKKSVYQAETGQPVSARGKCWPWCRAWLGQHGSHASIPTLLTRSFILNRPSQCSVLPADLSFPPSWSVKRGKHLAPSSPERVSPHSCSLTLRT